MRENAAEEAGEAFAFGLRRLRANRADLDPATRRRYILALRKVAQADDVYTPQEQALVRQFSRELQQI